MIPSSVEGIFIDFAQGILKNRQFGTLDIHLDQSDARQLVPGQYFIRRRRLNSSLDREAPDGSSVDLPLLCAGPPNKSIVPSRSETARFTKIHYPIR